MKKISGLILSVCLVLGGIAIPSFAKSCSGGHCSVSSTEGYYKKVVIKKVRHIKKSCATCRVAPPRCTRCRPGYRYRPFYRGYGTRFTGGPLQFRHGQPIRNALRVPARLAVRAGALGRGILRGVGRVLFPRRFF